MSSETVSGILRSDSQAAAALVDLEAAGLKETDVLVLMPSASVRRAPTTPSRPLRGLARLSPLGTTVGGLVGLLTGVAAVAAAGVGTSVFPLTLLAVLTTIAVGAAAGARAGTDVAQIVANNPMRRQRDARLLLWVSTESASQADSARRILETHAASEVAVEPAPGVG